MKKRLLCLLCALSLLTLFAACGSAGGDKMAVSETAAADTGWAEDAAAQENGAFAAVRENAKLILRADLSLEAQDFDVAAASIERLTASLGGYIESNGSSGELGSRYADYIVRVPQEKFETFLQQIGDACHVVSQNRSAEDIADQYSDMETRLATQKTKHERLLALLEKADRMEDIIALENALAECEYEIDSLTGQLRNYDSLVNFATVSLSLRETQTLSAVPGGTGFGAQLAQAAKSGLHGLTGFTRGFILTLTAVWPLLIVLAIAFVIFWKIRKRRRAQEQAEEAEQAARRAAALQDINRNLNPPSPDGTDDTKAK